MPNSCKGPNRARIQKWKFGYGGLWRILKLNAMHYGAIIPLHTCGIRPIQVIQTKLRGSISKKTKKTQKENSHFWLENSKSENILVVRFKARF